MIIKPFCRLRVLQISTRPFSTTISQRTNKILDAVRTPPAFHDYLRLCSANNTLLLGLFTTSSCTPCKTITPILRSITKARQTKAADKFTSLAFTEIELDSPDTSNGSVMELGMQYGVNNLPTLIGFGGRRAERVTDRVVETKLLSDRVRMEKWIDEQMQKGDAHPSDGGIGKGVFAKFFS